MENNHKKLTQTDETYSVPYCTIYPVLPAALLCQSPAGDAGLLYEDIWE